MSLRVSRSPARRAVDRLLTRPPRASVRTLFFRGLGGVYVVAFTSLLVQVRGLYGRRGIRPIGELVDRLHEAEVTWREAPTLFWKGASDAALVRACRAGQVAGLALVFDVWPRVAALAAWAIYGSFVTVGREFLGYQWDALLLETGAHAVAVARPGVLPARRPVEPSRFATWLMRFHVLRFYFESGYAKWRSGDRTWRELTACRWYNETAPLPTRLGYYAHQLPLGWQKFSTAAALGIEMGVPVLGLGPPAARVAAFGLFELLQAVIFATANYGFFNVLSAVLPVWLLDDAQLPRPLRASPAKRRRHPITSAIEIGLGSVLFALGALELARRVGVKRLFRLPARVRRVEAALAPWRLVGSYGLFSVMTTDRFEISVEGSDDGETWKAYEFRWKPGEPHHPPRLNAPHQPRLDWQMWFAALSTDIPSWFVAFAGRLLQGTPEVRRLLARDPFDGRAPPFLRATFWRYHMADLETHRRTGAWWTRERVGLFLPVVGLRGAGVARTT